MAPNSDAEEEPDAYEETSFIDPVPIDVEQAGGLASDSTALPSLRRELLQTAVDDYYAALADKGLLPSFGQDVSKFELARGGQLRLKDFPVAIVYSRGKPLALATIASRRGGSAAIRDGLGFVNWSARRKLPSVTQQALRKVDDEAATAALASTADIDERTDSLITAIDTAAHTTQMLPTDLLPLRELLGSTRH